MAKLCKATQDAYNWGEWLILLALLKNWVAEGAASKVNDICSKSSLRSFMSSLYFILLLDIVIDGQNAR